MSPIARILAVLLVAAAVSPAAAIAAPRPAPVARAVAVAARFWGAVPCANQVRILTGRPVPTGLQADSDAWVTFDSALGANDLSAPASTFSACTVSLGSTRWPTSASMVTDWDMLCMTMVHEMGHLLGRPHDDAPGSVMAPVFTDYAGEPAACRTARPDAASR